MFLLLFSKSALRILSSNIFSSKDIFPENDKQIIKGLFSYFIKKKDFSKKAYN